MGNTEKTAMLVRVDYCIGCQSCQIACQEQNNLDIEEKWLEAVRRKPKMVEGQVRMSHAIHQELDMCAKCLARLDGVQPMCVTNCSLDCLFVGPADLLLKKMQENSTGKWQLTILL
jgi:Fe-S-cluster-containing dehydrogenase component